MQKTPEDLLEKIENARKYQRKTLELKSRKNPEKFTHIPPELFELDQLEVLDLSGNALSLIPEEIGLLWRLTWLDVSDNGLPIVPDALGQLSHLKELYIVNNCLTDLPPCFSKLHQLRALHLNRNQFAAIPDSIFELSSLKILNLWGNYITDLSPKILQLTHLEKLNLEGNPLRTPPPEIAFRKDGTTSLENIRRYFQSPGIGRMDATTIRRSWGASASDEPDEPRTDSFIGLRPAEQVQSGYRRMELSNLQRVRKPYPSGF